MKPQKAAQKPRKKLTSVRADQEGQVFMLRHLWENAGAFAGMPEESCPFFLEDEDVLLWCLDTLAASPTALAHLQDAARRGWMIGLADLGGGGFCLDLGESTILLDRHAMGVEAFSRSAFFRTALLLALVRALRDIWQETRLSGAERIYAPESFLILSRLRAADMDVVALLTAWELRQAGYGAIWRHVIGSPEGDLALAFTRRAERTGAAEFSGGSGLAAAFAQWFGGEERLKATDHEALEFLDDVLRGAGSNNPFGRSRLGVELVESLSILPDGARYLTGYGQAILSDPTFHDIEDEINQAHLFHVMRDLESVRIGNVPFRDGALARRIFPDRIGQDL